MLLLSIAIKVLTKIFNLSDLFHISWLEELVLQPSSNFVLAFPNATPTPLLIFAFQGNAGSCSGGSPLLVSIGMPYGWQFFKGLPGYSKSYPKYLRHTPFIQVKQLGTTNNDDDDSNNNHDG